MKLPYWIIIILSVVLIVLLLDKCQNKSEPVINNNKIDSINTIINNANNKIDSLKIVVEKKNGKVDSLEKSTEILKKKRSGVKYKTVFDTLYIDTLYNNLVKCDSSNKLADSIITKRDSTVSELKGIVKDKDSIIQKKDTIIKGQQEVIFEQDLGLQHQEKEIKRLKNNNKKVGIVGGLLILGRIVIKVVFKI